MFEDKMYTHKNRNVYKREHNTIPAKEYKQSVRKIRNPNLGFIAIITQKIRKIRWPHVQQQFYVGRGVDWE